MSLQNIDAGRSESRCHNVPNVSCGFSKSTDILKRHFPDLVVSKQKLRRADAISCVRHLPCQFFKSGMLHLRLILNGFPKPNRGGIVGDDCGHDDRGENSIR
jgi:hypothetical protein